MTPLRVFFFLFTVLPLGVFAQQGAVTGKVTDESSAPVSFVSVLLIHASDSSLVKSAISGEQGEFDFDAIDSGTYRVLISAVGFKKMYSPEFTVENATYQLGTLALQADNTLDEMEIVAQKPFIERKFDKTIVNVENSIVAAGNNALEVLKRSPGVMVDKDGNISLKGRQGVTIMIDGKPTYLSAQDLSEMLKNMPADQLEKIELITNPSAKFDAAGNAGVINIVLKKNQNYGANGRFNVGYGQGVYAKQNAGVNLNYRVEKWNFFGNYNYNHNEGFNRFDMTRNFRINDQLDSRFEQFSRQTNNSQTHTGKIGFDFYPAKKHTVGMFVNGMSNRGSDQGQNQTYISSSGDQLQSGSYTGNHNHNRWQNLSSNLNYKFDIDTTGKELLVNLDYAQFDNNTRQNYFTDYFDSTQTVGGMQDILISRLPSKVKIYSAKADYTHPVGQNMRFEAGVKTSYVNTDNDAQFWNRINDVDYVDSTKTNHFRYTENINAAYVNWQVQLSKKWSFQAGLRGEQTLSKGEQITTDSTFNRNYFQLFPSGFLSWKINEKNELSLNYSRRINRPNYRDLNPFLYFLDPYTYMQGNTLLQPEYTHSMELTHTFMGFISSTLSYSKTTDVITQVTRQVDSTRTTYATNENLNTQENYSFSTMLPIPVRKWWTSMNYFIVFYNRYQGELQGGNFNEGMTSWLINSTNMFTFNKGWSAELSAFYMARQVYGIFIMKPMSNVTVGIQKTVLKDKGTIKLSYSDIFVGNRFRGNVRYQNMDIGMDTRYDSRVLNLTFNYRFGNAKAGPNKRKESGAGDEIDRAGKGSSGVGGR